MQDKLFSLTDQIKKQLYFFEKMTLEELAFQLKTTEGLTEILSNNPAFQSEQPSEWSLNLTGNSQNQYFYAYLLKKQQPVNLSQILPKKGTKKRKEAKFKFNVASLQADARFINWKSGVWGLTEWTAQLSQLPLKQVLIKFLKTNPGGLSLSQIQQLLPPERNYHLRTLEIILHKFPYFSASSAGIWHYNAAIHLSYEQTVQKYLTVLQEQRQRQQLEKQQSLQKQQQLNQQLNQLQMEYRQTTEELNRNLTEQIQQTELARQSLEQEYRPQIAAYQQQLARLEQKAQSILQQCRLWMGKAESEQARYQKTLTELSKTQNNLINLEEKFQLQEAEQQRLLTNWQQKDLEQQDYLTGLKLQQTIEVSNLKEQISGLRERLSQVMELAMADQEAYKQELNDLQEELHKIRQQKVKACLELAEERTNRKLLEEELQRPLVRLSRVISSFWSRPAKYPPKAETLRS